MYKSIKSVHGLAQIPLMIMLLLMAIAVPVATKLVQDNTENRGQAIGDGGCACKNPKSGKSSNGSCNSDGSCSCPSGYNTGTNKCTSGGNGGGGGDVSANPTLSPSSSDRVCVAGNLGIKCQGTKGTCQLYRNENCSTECSANCSLMAQATPTKGASDTVATVTSTSLYPVDDSKYGCKANEFWDGDVCVLRSTVNPLVTGTTDYIGSSVSKFKEGYNQEKYDACLKTYTVGACSGYLAPTGVASKITNAPLNTTGGENFICCCNGDSCGYVESGLCRSTVSSNEKCNRNVREPVDFLTDAFNCGSEGVQCTEGYSCKNGTCVKSSMVAYSPPAGSNVVPTTKPAGNNKSTNTNNTNNTNTNSSCVEQCPNPKDGGIYLYTCNPAESDGTPDIKGCGWGNSMCGGSCYTCSSGSGWVKQSDNSKCPVPTTIAGEAPVLNYKIAFGGVNPSAAQCVIDWPLQFIVLSGGESKAYSGVLHDTESVANGKLVLGGSLKLTGFTKTSNIAAFIKNPKSLQTKYFKNNQTSISTQPGGELTLTSSKSTSPIYDFTGFPMMPGDVVGTDSETQDGWINGVDFAYVKAKSLVHETVSVGGYLKGDLDGNCQVNSNDINLLKISLQEKQGQLY